MKIKPVQQKSLSEIVAGKITALILEGEFLPNHQLPSERDLGGQLDVSRSSLREALKILGEHKLIEARPGVGWFVRPIEGSTLLKARELAQSETIKIEPKKTTRSGEGAPGPRRLPVAKEKPLKIPNLGKDRLGTFDFISWWERDKVAAAKVLIVGAGALGNEVVKNLTLMGVGQIFVIDFDTIEAANLSRSVLFRETDSKKKKSQVAAARAKELNPDTKIQYLHGDVTTELGLGIIRRMDVIIGCLDNREARLAVNRFAHWMGKPWVDGAIQELLGLVRVFVPGQGACYECTLTEEARRDLALRYSCPLLARQNILLGKVPTTPTIASIIGAMQSQEALKIIHDMDVEAGKVIHYNGLTNQMHTTSYTHREDCESHWIYGDITELPISAHTTTLKELLQIIKIDLGDEAVIELDQEIVLELMCTHCKTTDHTISPMSQVSFEAAHCPNCGEMREVKMTHLITGEESFLGRTLFSLGIPPLHILRANNTQEYRFYELTGDLEETLHFKHFEHKVEQVPLRDRIKIGKSIKIKSPAQNPAAGKIKLKD
ncbi:MAG: ThiF family adenylyltransferase [Anaerolineales bacterium]